MSAPLDNLVKVGRLAPFTPARTELENLRKSGRLRLRDSADTDLALESRFDLAYNGVFALALSALHASGYKPTDRIYALLTLEHTTSLTLGHRQVILKAHGLRNQMEYEGEQFADTRLLTDLIAAGNALAALLPDP